MFIAFALAAMLCYAIHDSLITKVSREMESMTLASYRGLSLALSMSPVLLLASGEQVLGILDHFPKLIAASALTLFGVIFFSRSLQLLPLGIGAAVRLSSLTISAVLIGLFFFGEELLSQQYLFIGIILFGIIILGYQPIQVKHLKEKNIPLGFLYAILMGIAIAGGSSMMGSISRDLNPFVAGYFWESFIGIVGISFCLLRSFIIQKPFPRISTKQFKNLFLRAAPAGIGSSFFALAIASGSVGITNAMLAGVVVITSLFGYFFLQEKLSVKHWIGISTVIVGIICVNISIY